MKIFVCNMDKNIYITKADNECSGILLNKHIIIKSLILLLTMKNLKNPYRGKKATHKIRG